MTHRMQEIIVGTCHVDLAKRLGRIHPLSRPRPGIHGLRIRPGMYACNGILFNHESPRRGETFVTRKITRGLANISQGLEDCLFMGNIDALRDWGHAKDYVRIDPRYFRPTEVETLLGDPSKAKQKLGWVPEITAQEMCAEMVANDLAEAKKHALLKHHGYSVNVSIE